MPEPGPDVVPCSWDMGDARSAYSSRSKEQPVHLEDFDSDFGVFDTHSNQSGPPSPTKPPPWPSFPSSRLNFPPAQLSARIPQPSTWPQATTPPPQPNPLLRRPALPRPLSSVPFILILALVPLAPQSPLPLSLPLEGIAGLMRTVPWCFLSVTAVRCSWYPLFLVEKEKEARPAQIRRPTHPPPPTQIQTLKASKGSG